jgi:hypothetical protein
MALEKTWKNFIYLRDSSALVPGTQSVFILVSDASTWSYRQLGKFLKRSQMFASITKSPVFDFFKNSLAAFGTR